MLVAEGVFDAEGAFLGLPSLDSSAIEELFRRLLLRRLHQAERLSEEFMLKLFAWSPSGFSVNAAQLVRDLRLLLRLHSYQRGVHDLRGRGRRLATLVTALVLR